MTRAAAVSLFGLTVLGVGACQANPSATASICLPAKCKLSTAVRWAVAIDPPAASGSLPTQIANKLVDDGVILQVDSPTRAVVTMTPSPGSGPIPPQADLVLSIPTVIPGLPDPSFQSPVSALLNGGVFAPLLIPGSALMAHPTARLMLQPLSPGDQTLPTYQWSVQVDASISFSFPGDDILIHGQLLSAGNQPLASQSKIVARAFQNGQQVSNAPLVHSDGQFELRIPSVVAADPVTLSLAPTSRSSSDPWFVSTPFMASAGQNLGTINLPAYVLPPGVFTVTTQDAAGNPLGGVLIAAVTPLGNAVVSGGGGGSATFQNAAVTDATGIAQLSLLPGTVNRIPYYVLATPPIGSPYAIQCVMELAGPGPQALPKITLLPRPLLSGTVLAADKSPVPNVTVTATGTPDPPAPGCLAPSAISAGTTTDAQGNFTLPLDAGTYRIDYDPPPGSLAPRKTYPSVPIDSSVGPQQVTLLPGTWLTGTVLSPDPDHLPVASAAVRFFEICNDPTTCPGSLTPNLVAATFTDAGGRFQVAVPDPAAASARSGGFDTAGAGP